MATDKRLTFDIDANNAEAIRSLDEIQRKALNVQQTLSKTASKSVANNSTVTSKDTSSVYRGLDDLQSSIQSLTSQMQTLKGARENLLASGGRNSDIAKLNTTLGQLVQGLSNVYRTTGADGNRISNRGGKFSQDLDRVNNSHVRATSA